MFGLGPYWTFILICVAAAVYVCWSERRAQKRDESPAGDDDRRAGSIR